MPKKIEKINITTDYPDDRKNTVVIDDYPNPEDLRLCIVINKLNELMDGILKIRTVSDSKEWTVIGNVFENPELIK